ncbi:GntR family transcriptional regulator [Streptomyces beigongshangae]|uniref:GntR family transcriptional regulator n=1 Tax=Streptomyces beigongshangae TaxID=2841597 RepID=UPI001C859E9A|nr:GntR family transcriptional regulator [Streptomyces sp. REN17]
MVLERALHMSTGTQMRRRHEAPGRICPGSQLPGVLAIQGAFGIAQMTARRVLTELREAGLAQMQPGIGTFVTELPKP